MAYDFTLTPAELSQLRWHLENTQATPQSSQDERRFFEIKRSLARWWAFVLVNQGDEVSYQKFIVEQQAPVLSFENFKCLSAEAAKLSKLEKEALRVTCFLTITDKAKDVLGKEAELKMSHDSEEFLSELVRLPQEKTARFPLLAALSQEGQELLQKAYWPRTHLRHMLYTEGGNAMFASLQQGIQNGAMTLSGFRLWKWRWLVNLFGWEPGAGSKYYNDTMHTLTYTLLNKLEGCFEHPREEISLEPYLRERASLAGITPKEEITQGVLPLLGHLAALFNKITILALKKVLEYWTDTADFIGWRVLKGAYSCCTLTKSD